MLFSRGTDASTDRFHTRDIGQHSRRRLWIRGGQGRRRRGPHSPILRRLSS